MKMSVKVSLLFCEERKISNEFEIVAVKGYDRLRISHV